MRPRSRRWCPTLALAACGCVFAPGSNGETQASGSETQTSDSETQALDIEAQTSDSDSETSGGETSGGETSGGETQMSDCGPAPIPDMHVAQDLPACMQEPGVLRVDDELNRVWVTEGGHEIDLEMPGSVVGTSVNGDWIAVASYAYNSRFLGVFARHTGERVWCRNVDHAVPWDWEGWGYWEGIRVSEDGQTVVTQVTPVPHMDNWYPETVLLISAESAWSWWADGRVVADPALGYVVVEKVVDPFAYSRTTGWLGLDDHIFHEGVPEPTYISAAVGEDDHTLDYWYQGSYVRARIGESKSIAVQPDGSGLSPSPPGIFHIESYGICPNHLLLRYDVETGNILPVDPEPPPGWSFVPIDHGRPPVPCNSRLDYEGTTMYFLLYHDAEAQLWAYDIEGDKWEAVGLPLTDCGDAVGYGSFRLEMVSHDVIMVTTKCSWDDSEFEYRLLRRDPPLSLTLQIMEYSYSDSSTWLKIDSQQQCAAHLTDDGWDVWTLDGSNDVFHASDVSWSWLD